MFDGGKPLVLLLAVIAAPAARLVVAVTPVPLSVAPIGVLVPLLVMARVAFWAPPALGAKVTAIAQEAPAARVLPQVLAWV